jgi:hypothetical protein
MAAKHGNKSLDSLIAGVRDADRRRRTAELIARVNALSAPPPRKPDWKASDEAKQLSAQMIGDVQKLADEGRVIDLTDYNQAIKTYNDWVEKCSVAIGRIDSQMRRFGRNTNYKYDWDKGNRVWHKHLRDEEDDKHMFRLELSGAIAGLNLLASTIKVNTLPDIN